MYKYVITIQFKYTNRNEDSYDFVPVDVDFVRGCLERVCDEYDDDEICEMDAIYIRKERCDDGSGASFYYCDRYELMAKTEEVLNAIIKELDETIGYRNYYDEDENQIEYVIV